MMWPLPFIKSSLPFIAFAMGGLGGIYMNYRILATGNDVMYPEIRCFGGSGEITPEVYRTLFENEVTKPGE